MYITDPTNDNTHTLGNKLCRYAKALDFGDLHFRLQKDIGLTTIIAVHSVKRGPAIGGCRFITYDCIESAIEDALGLAQMMSYKSALLDLPHGGAKAVIVAPNQQAFDRTAILEAYGDFVDSLGGNYITAVDCGTLPTDMDIIANRTPYVLCTTSDANNGINAAFHTAMGVLEGIKAAVLFRKNQDNLQGIHVAIQGAGEVGSLLAKNLATEGAQLTMSDISKERLTRCVKDFGAKAVDVNDIYHVPCDVFSPCALGGILNKKTIPTLQTSIVAGSANTQLATPLDGEALHHRGILYAPDFIINAGGLIYAAAMYSKSAPIIDRVTSDVHSIQARLLTIFEQAKSKNLSTSHVANIIAKEKL